MVRQAYERIAEPIRGFQKAAYLRISAPIRGLHQAAYLLAGLTLASQSLALIRDRTFAHTFGAGQVLDLYYAAFRVPDLVFALVSSLVSAYVLIPLITDMDREDVRRLLSESATFLFAVGGALCVVLGFFMPQFLTLLYPKLAASSHQAEFILFARILLAQPILLGLSSIIASVTQANRRFVLFALSPVLYNLGIILGAVVFYPLWGLPGIGIGVVIGAVGYLAVHIPVVISAGAMPSFRFPTFSLMSSVVRNSMPRSLALGVNSITMLVLTAMASRLGTGDIAVFTFAGNLEAVPLALIGSSYAVAAFPALSEAISQKKHEEFMKILSASARHIILWSLVALGLIVVLRAHVVRIILGTGAFDWNATRLTAALLAICAVGLAVDALELLFSRALYAARQSWRPLAYQLAAGVFTIALAVFLLATPSTGLLSTISAILKVSDVPGVSILLLALANVLGQFFLVFLSLIALRGVAPGLGGALVRPAIDGCIAAVAGGAAAYGVLVIGGGIMPLTTLVAVLTQGVTACVVGLAAAALALYLTENEEFRIVMQALLKLLYAQDKQSSVPKSSVADSTQP
ncbi:MAG: lipid II flippase MurJ [Candidatus Paceibacterota bacterium]